MTSSMEVSMLSESTGGLRAFCGAEEDKHEIYSNAIYM